MIETKGSYRGIGIFLDTDDEKVNEAFDYDLALGRLGLINERKTDNRIGSVDKQGPKEF